MTFKETQFCVMVIDVYMNKYHKSMVNNYGIMENCQLHEWARCHDTRDLKWYQELNYNCKLEVLLEV